MRVGNARQVQPINRIGATVILEAKRVFGTALAASKPGKDTIPVFVQLR